MDLLLAGEALLNHLLLDVHDGDRGHGHDDRVLRGTLRHLPVERRNQA